MNNKEIVEKLTTVFKLRYPPIAFFYTDNPPCKIYKPKKKSIENRPCIIQLLNGVKSGRPLVLGKKSRNLCPGGLTYLGFREPVDGTADFLSEGIFDKEGNKLMEGERFVKTPKLAKDLLDSIPFRKSTAEFAVFIPLNQVDSEVYKPLLVIFFINLDQLTGLTQLSNFDTINKARMGVGSNCQTIIAEPLLELENGNPPRAIIGCLSDTTTRKYLKLDEATITVSYDRLLEMDENIDKCFLELNPWKTIYDRIK
ncbi:MAG: DUF169 domain-containing protein [Promethearchaeota archaeon]